jgi:hypothetical protein
VVERTLADRLKELLAARERLDAHIVELAGLWDARRAWADDGATRAEDLARDALRSEPAGSGSDRL